MKAYEDSVKDVNKALRDPWSLVSRAVEADFAGHLDPKCIDEPSAWAQAEEWIRDQQAHEVGGFDTEEPAYHASGFCQTGRGSAAVTHTTWKTGATVGGSSSSTQWDAPRIVLTPKESSVKLTEGPGAAKKGRDPSEVPPDPWKTGPRRDSSESSRATSHSHSWGWRSDDGTWSDDTRSSCTSSSSRCRPSYQTVRVHGGYPYHVPPPPPPPMP